MAKEQKILSITARDFQRGLGNHVTHTDTPLYLANGWTVFRYGKLGVFCPNTSATDMDSDQSHLDSPILAMVPRGDGYIYMMASNGDMFKVNNTAGSIGAGERIRSDNGFTGSDGLEFYKPQGGTEYMYYWNGTQIGRWDISGTYPTGWTDNHFTGLQSTNYRPTHKFNGKIFYGNKDRIGMVYDNAGTAANNTNVLDFESDYTVYDITDDGTYLVISVNNGEHTKFLFWDTFSPSWNKEHTIPDPAIVPCLQKRNNEIWAAHSWGFYRFSYYETPIKVFSELAGEIDPGRSNAKGLLGGAVLFGGNGGARSFGAYMPGYPEAGFRPFYIPSQSAQTASAILVYSEQTVLVAINSRLYKFVGSAGGASTDINFFTPLFDLGDTYQITKVEILVDRPQFASASLLVYKDSNISSNYTFSTTSGGNNQKLVFYPDTQSDSNLFTNYLGLKPTFTFSSAGDVHVKGIKVYGVLADTADTPIPAAP